MRVRPLRDPMTFVDMSSTWLLLTHLPPATSAVYTSCLPVSQTALHAARRSHSVLCSAERCTVLRGAACIWLTVLHSKLYYAECRLEVLQLMLREWRGPASIAIFIEFPHGTPQATQCRGLLTRFLDQNLRRAWNVTAEMPPLAVSLLYARETEPGASCDVPAAPRDLPPETHEARASPSASMQPDDRALTGALTHCLVHALPGALQLVNGFMWEL